MTAKTLFDQTSEGTRSAAASLCGIFGPLHDFNFTLKVIAALPDPFTCGDIARAFMRHRLASLEMIQAENQADADRRVTLRFTPLEREAVQHRLMLWDSIEEVFRDTEGMVHVMVGAADRAHALSDMLASSPDCTLVCNGTEMDEEIICETISGSTWNARADAEATPQKKAAARRALEGAARKIEVAFGLPDPIDIPEA